MGDSVISGRIQSLWCLRVAKAGILSMLCNQVVEASVLTANSVSFSDVTAAVNLAKDGDIVKIPAGTATWTNTLQLTKNITLQGATTVVRDGETSFTVTDGTIIKDGLTGSNSITSSVIYCKFPATAASYPRVSGITFDGTASTNPGGSVLSFDGNNHNVRIDNCNWIKNTRYCLFMNTGTADIWGVMDHCSSTQDSGAEKFSINHGGYGGKTDGNGSWTDDPHFGSDHAFYIEDCRFASLGTGWHGNLDAQNGGRRVERHCYFLGTKNSNHGTEIHRGCRVVEAYLNTFDERTSGALGMDTRAGTGLYWGNTYLTKPGFAGYNINIYRQTQAQRIWGASNGTNCLDNNDTEGNGTYVAGHSPHLYFSGPISARVLNSNGLPTSITLNGIDGTRNWAGYTISDLGSGTVSLTSASANMANIALIVSNSGTTLTVTATANQNSTASNWAVGNAVAIYRLARASLDQPGMGKSDLITGNPPTNTQWPNQQSEPIYSWLNTLNGSNFAKMFKIPLNSPYPTVRENRDFYNWNTNFDGKTGVGAGPLSARPSTCTTGVGYWAADQNTLYVATATNTWSVYYKPYVYPHPLTIRPLPPTNLTMLP